jgi:hypothetical protein
MSRRSSIFLTAAIGLLSATGLMELYCRTPLDVRLPPLQLPDEETLTLVFHGSVDADNPQFPRLIEVLGQEGKVVRFVRWDPWSDTRLRAAASAQRAGEQVADQLIAQWEKTRRLRDLKLIAHSSGAYVLDALCERLRERMATPPNIDMLFVDPFQIHGFVDWIHGAREHGRCADRAEAIINTDDPAPATNRPLAHARNVDVTLDVRRANFKENGHYWALEYLILESADRTH